MVRTLRSHCRRGTKIPQAVLHGQKKNPKQNKETTTKKNPKHLNWAHSLRGPVLSALHVLTHSQPCEEGTVIILV